jgi:hypothetical protein
MNAAIIASIAASCVAILVAVAAIFTAMFRRGINEGRQTEIMSQLTALGADHEARLRALEHPPRR